MKLAKVTRSEMGAYLCIASNGIPPTVSKRIMVNASPRSINYWVRDTGEMVISSDKYDVQSAAKSMFETRMLLTIRYPSCPHFINLVYGGYLQRWCPCMSDCIRITGDFRATVYY
ncbi:hypothetical protein B566_EDAN011445 [Ephemera danica]|nr:hypothetical protein B566_EDAN011445 [Ephemera danica]